jgi:TolB protein
MPSKLIMVAALSVLGIAVVAAAAFLLIHDDSEPARGELVAYSCKESGTPLYGICVIRKDGTASRHLTSGITATDPAWSPSGGKIAFTRRENVGESTTFSEDDVFVMDSDGGGEEQLTEERDGQHADHPAWSPDGREIVFVRGDSVSTTLPARPGELFVMDVDRREVRVLTRGSRDQHPAWSPDGRMIAFTRAESPPYAGIWTVAATGGPPRRLTGLPGTVDSSAAWSPDGSRIAFTRTRPESEYDGRASIFVMDRDGTNVHELIRHRYFTCCTFGLAWSPDGRTIAFETSPSRACVAIALVDVTSGRVRPLTTCTLPGESAFSPAWQPDTTLGEDR